MSRDRPIVASTSTRHSWASFCSKDQVAAASGQHVGAGVVDPDVDAGLPVPGRLCQPCASLLVGQVGRQDGGFSPYRANLLRQLLSRLAACVAVHDHVGAGPGQLAGNRPADPA